MLPVLPRHRDDSAALLPAGRLQDCRISPVSGTTASEQRALQPLAPLQRWHVVSGGRLGTAWHHGALCPVPGSG